jgi:hypothetical protein
MAENKISYKRFCGGIADSLKEGSNQQVPDQYYFGRSINHRDDPQALTLLPGAILESGSVVTGLLKDSEIIPSTLDSYFYDINGQIYRRTQSGSWSSLRTVANSHGNGMAYFSGDDNLYYTSDSLLGKYGSISNNPQFIDDIIGSQGGQRLNTYSATLVSSSSQYASRADTASLSLTGDFTLECQIDPASLPATGQTQTLISKWDESGATRSYKFDIAGIAATFGDGTDGNLTISADTTEAPIDSACTGTSGNYTLSATNASFVPQQEILIHQTQGTNAGNWMRTSIISYTAGTITTSDPLNMSYTSGAQVRVLKKYGNVTVNTGVTWTAKAWNGTTGGILGFLCNGTFTRTGNINLSGKGFIGGAGRADYAYTGEGTNGVSFLYNGSTNNGNGGGGAHHNGNTNNLSLSGAGGGNNVVGNNGSMGQVIGGLGGYAVSNNTLTTINLGGGSGGGAHATSFGGSSGNGGIGGGIFFAYCSDITGTGSIDLTGTQGTLGNDGADGGSGAGGDCLLKCITSSLGSNVINASGGASNGTGGKGGDGIIHVDYYTSVTGTTIPTLNSNQDNNLANNTTYQLRLAISSTGNNSEIMARTCGLAISLWKSVAVKWTASSHISEFLLNGNSLGTSVGAFTAVHDNASTFQIGMYKNATVPTSFYNGKIDEVRIWNIVRSNNDINNNKDIQINPSTWGLVAYYQLNNNWLDSTSNNNNLTPTNSPNFSTDTPFLSPSTRLDIDLTQTATDQTYTLPTAIAETVANKVFFTPTKEPLKSISVKVDTIGTGDWTLTLHDSSNIVIASKTVLNANMLIGDFEFIFTSPIRPIPNAVYHFHLTSTVADGKVVTNVASDLSTVQYNTYFQVLVTDTLFHPIVQFQYQPLGGTLTGAMIIGNERYLSVWDGANYEPNFITLGLGWKVRCFAFWRNYLAIGVWKGDDIRGWHMGRIYFWTGYQPSFDFFIDVPEGQVNSMFGVDSNLYIFAGFRGMLLNYQGGTGTRNSISNKVKRMPLLEPECYTEVYPKAFNTWRGLLHFGLYANSDSTNSEKGVYSFGTLNQWYPESLSYDYPISTGSRSSSVKIGLIHPIGQDLLIGWQDGLACGCDVVNFSNPPASNGLIEFLLNDGGTVWKYENNTIIRLDHDKLRTGESIAPKRSFDRTGGVAQFIDLKASSTVGDIALSQPIPSGRASEIQVGATLSQTGGTSPVLKALTIAQESLSEEQQL